MNDESKQAIKDLQLKMLRIQQGIWHKKERVIIVFEGMDAAGKGGAIKKVTENLDPRGVMVHPIGPPTAEEKGKHWLYRFWRDLPSPGVMAIFDRSWYGRVLVERVDELTEKKNWKRGYDEINEFEQMLKADGIHIIKIFLKISKKEQLKRFVGRLSDPYKQWKVTEADLLAREKWDVYGKAIKDMHAKTDVIPWHIIETDDKTEAREEVLKVITAELKENGKWMEHKAVDKNKLKALS
ncbi:MAG TPA: hypothetical protein VNJ08_00770 [Bacteriovoracaceae bacterium]|nr:hypothetical protein [Bacteriovoracaceae bacterium]